MTPHARRDPACHVWGARPVRIAVYLCARANAGIASTDPSIPPHVPMGKRVVSILDRAHHTNTSLPKISALSTTPPEGTQIQRPRLATRQYIYIFFGVSFFLTAGKKGDGL